MKDNVQNKNRIQYLSIIIYGLWFYFFVLLNNTWKKGILLLLGIHLYYQIQYLKSKRYIHKKASELTLGMSVHATLFGWYLLHGRHRYNEAFTK
tara:strand:+ start:2345 stop:2626 length:282 start_codon:yes stop_codon:yes gene_type:complete